MSNLFGNLNEEQINAVQETEGYVRVIAGAGCGKTKTLTSRYVYLVNELGITSSNILCVTFTNKASQEMKKRVRNMLGDIDTSFICTFHSLGVYLLREDIQVLNYPKNFIVLDDDDKESILKNIYEKFNINTRVCSFKQAIDYVRKRKSNFNYINEFINNNTNYFKDKCNSIEEIEEKIFYGYIFEQKKNYGIDFDDILNFSLFILENFDEIRKKWQKRLMYIMVDEFQDVNNLQYRLVTLLSEYHKNLFIVGDPDQTIYSWRGANVNYILNFDKVFDNCKTFILDKNYRSTKQILDVANSLIKNNKNRIDTSLQAVNIIETQPVIFNHFKTTNEESEWIANKINELNDNGVTNNDIAILYRAHFISRSIEETFIKKGIKYILYSGIEFYKRKEIKDIISYLRMIIYSDDLSFLRIINEPKRNIGDIKVKFLQDYSIEKNCSLYQSLKENIDNEIFKKTKGKDFIELIEKYKKTYKEMNIGDIVDGILVDTGYEEMLFSQNAEERIENIAELKQSIFEYENLSGEDISLDDYIQRVSLFTNNEIIEKKNSVKMMTVHLAKGLEFKYVFVCGLNEGIFPSRKIKNKNELEEERRLAYVAFTRAEKMLFLTDSEGINYDGSFRYPSRFILNVEKKYLDYKIELEENLIDGTKRNENERLVDYDALKFKIGDRVTHNVFGDGIIKEISLENDGYIIEFGKSERCISIQLAERILSKL